MSRTLDEMALIAGCYDLDAELRYIADSPAPEHGGFHPRVVAAVQGAVNVIAEARAALEVETQRRCELGAAYHEEARRHADTESELAEARAALAARKSAWEQVADTEHRLRRECEDTIDTLRAEVAKLQRYVREDEERGDGRLDCGSNSCLTAPRPLTGARLNGNCTCGTRALRLAIQKARAEVAALRQEHEAEANAWEREVDVARHQIASLREVAGLVREWQAARRNMRAEFLDPTHRGRVTSKEESNERGLAIKAVTAIEARLLAAVIPEVSRG